MEEATGSTKQRIFHIDVGKILEEEMEEYLRKTVAKFKKSNVDFPKDIKIPDFDITWANEYKRKD